MKLVIKNLGSLQHAEIDLSKRFYLFTGYNNTGKTYVTKLLYALFQKETLSNFSKSYRKNQELEGKDNIELSLEMVQAILGEFSLYIAKTLLPKIFQIDKEHLLLRNLKIEFHFDMQKDIVENELKAGGSFKIRSKEDGIDIFTLEKAPQSNTVRIKKETNEDIYHKLPEGFFDNISKEKFDKDLEEMKNDLSNISLVDSLLRLLIQNQEQAFFLPAQRGFILENASDFLTLKNKRTAETLEMLVEATEGENIGNEEVSKILKNRLTRNTTSDVDFLLGKIAELRNSKDDSLIQGNNYYTDFLQKMQDIMGGEIVMEKLSSVSNWTEKFKMQGADNEESINLYLASSSANQLALLFQFFKYWAKPERNFLMIDEPEINLHPENQIKVMDLLLSFASEKSNRVLVTTHSPLIGEVLNNYLLANKLGDENATLSIEETVMYAFNGRIMSEQSMGDYGATYLSFKFAQDKVEAESSELMERVYQKLKPVY